MHTQPRTTIRLDNSSAPLDHEGAAQFPFDLLVKGLRQRVAELDQRHPMDRKIRFLLDVRGYIKMNGIRGMYVEYGCYKCEMLAAAHSVFGSLGAVERYVGLDTFRGEPALEGGDFASGGRSEGDFESEYEEVQRGVARVVGESAQLIRGDFRCPDVLVEVPRRPIAVAVIDCNLLSSIVAGLKHALTYLTGGGLLYIDDYLTGCGDGTPRVREQLEQISSSMNIELESHSFYAPFGKSFLVWRNTK